MFRLFLLTGGLRGWDRPAALAGLREAFGSSLVMENDVDAAALAERALGHGREVDNFAFVHIGTGVGMGLVLGGQLLRGAHGVAGEICAIITVVDPDLVVLGGGIGRAPGFAEAVTTELEQIAPVMPAIRVSALGTDAVVDGCLSAGTELAWGQVMSVLPTVPATPAVPSGDGLRPL